MGILSQYESIMRTDYRISLSKLNKITNELEYYMWLDKTITWHQRALGRIPAEKEKLLEYEIECKKTLDASTDKVLKLAAVAKDRGKLDSNAEYQECLIAQKSARAVYDAAMRDTRRVHELHDKLMQNLYDLKILKKYIGERAFGGVFR